MAEPLEVRSLRATKAALFKRLTKAAEKCSDAKSKYNQAVSAMSKIEYQLKLVNKALIALGANPTPTEPVTTSEPQ